MPRLAFLVALATVPAPVFAACGGDGGGGGADGAPEVDGGGGGEGPRDRVEGEIAVDEGMFGEGGEPWSYVQASILDPRPQFMTLAMEAGACRMWTYQPADCGLCTGICDRDGICVPYPTPLSAGALTIGGVAGGDIVMEPSEYGYYLPGAPPADLFAPGDEITASAAGGDQVDAFALAAAGVDPIAVDLVEGGEDGREDTLRLEDGADLTVGWEPARPGTRVRLEINSNNGGHGLPVDAMIECEADDGGSLAVPREMIEAFPAKPYQNICAGIDCPPSSLTRYRYDRAAVGDLEVELRVEFRTQFIVVHEP